MKMNLSAWFRGLRSSILEKNICASFQTLNRIVIHISILVYILRCLLDEREKTKIQMRLSLNDSKLPEFERVESNRICEIRYEYS